MTRNDDWIIDAPRLELGFLPTPLMPLTRLSQRLGGPRLWIKRDDCTGLGTGGNKTRKLEYLLSDARAQGADVVITYGAVQSNHARQTAAACARLGLPCHLLLARKVPWSHPSYESAGNVVLDRVFGATVTLVAPDAMTAAREALLASLDERGLLPYEIPVGGSNHLGAMGYARCALELAEQAESANLALTDVVHASSSAGTQAGLLAGFAGLYPDDAGARPRIHGVNVSEADPAALPAEVLRLAGEVLNHRGLDAAVEAPQVRVDDAQLGPGYGLPTADTVAAIELLGRTEGIALDPVYSGKAFASLLQRLRDGDFAGTEDVIFLHTGGSAVLGVYDGLFGQAQPL